MSPERPRTGPVRLRIVLVAEEGALAGQSFAVEGDDVFLFGRDADCHARITDDPYVSRHHFLIRMFPQDVVLRDLGSRNGTAVNGAWSGGKVRRKDGRVESRQGGRDLPLKDGDEIRVGHTAFRVHVEVPQGGPQPRQGAGTATTASVSSPGPAIAGYRMLRELGSGSSGTTFLATSPAGVQVALKLFQAASDDVARARFLRECNVLRELDHPNIVRYVDAGIVEGAAYLAMEYCDLGSVKDLAAKRGGRLPGREARDVFLQAARGLAHAHRCDLVHRDLKPENLLLQSAPQGQVLKIGDFGLAKIYTTAGLSGLTMTGSAGGTPGYMPREQLLEFKRLRPASDVWSLAASFYELLTAALPRVSTATRDPLRVVLEGVVMPIRERRPDVPAGLARVLERALEADPDMRYQDGGELLAALEAVL